MTPRALALAVAAAVAGAPAASASVLHVGPGQRYARPCQAIARAHAGDTIQIDARGRYRGDVCAWSTNRLTLIGVHGRAHIDAAGANSEGKAIWVIAGNHTTIENVELSGARVGDDNGAGIRLQGAGLTLRHCLFDHNQEGILAGDNPVSDIVDARRYDSLLTPSSPCRRAGRRPGSAQGFSLVPSFQYADTARQVRRTDGGVISGAFGQTSTFTR
jgi:hypothetical protein